MEEGAKPLSDIPAINRFLSYCRIRTVPSKTVVIHGDRPDPNRGGVWNDSKP